MVVADLEQLHLQELEGRSIEQLSMQSRRFVARLESSRLRARRGQGNGRGAVRQLSRSSGRRQFESCTDTRTDTCARTDTVDTDARARRRRGRWMERLRNLQRTMRRRHAATYVHESSTVRIRRTMHRLRDARV